jgi:hypothetical protein
MGKVRSVKGLPLLRKDLSRKVKASKEKQVLPPELAASTEPVLKPSAAGTEGGSAVPTVITGTSRGLHLLPGTAVSSLAQRPSAEKPQRPIVYTTRVLMQQKIRDYMNTPGVENMAFPIPASAHYTQQSRLFGSDTATSASPSWMMQQRGWPPGVSFDDSLYVNGSGSSSAWESLVSEKVSDFRYTLAETSDPSGKHATSPPRNNNSAPDHQRPTGGEAVPTKPTSGYISTERVPPSSDEEGDELGSLNLELSVAEWSLILDAARAEAHEMNLDIMQGSEMYEGAAGKDISGQPEFAEQFREEQDSTKSDGPQLQEEAAASVPAVPGSAEPDHALTVRDLLNDPRRSPLHNQHVFAAAAQDHRPELPVPALASLLSDEENWRPAQIYSGGSSPPRQRPDAEGFQQLAALLARSYGIPDARASQHRTSSPRAPAALVLSAAVGTAAAAPIVQQVQVDTAKPAVKLHAHGLAFPNATRHASPERDREVNHNPARPDQANQPWVLSAVAPAFTAHPASARKVRIAGAEHQQLLFPGLAPTAPLPSGELSAHPVRPLAVELPRTPMKLTDDDSDCEDAAELH